MELETHRCPTCWNRQEPREYVEIWGKMVMVYECPLCDDPSSFFPAKFTRSELMMMKGVASKGIEQEVYE